MSVQLGVLLLFTTISNAQIESGTSTGTDDIVRLRAGGYLRGALLPYDRAHRSEVQLRLPTGEVVALPWAEVHYSGPAGPELSGPRRRVRITSNIPSLDVYQVGSDAPSYAGLRATIPPLMQQVRAPFALLCHAPCELDLPSAPLRLAAQPGRGRMAMLESPIDLAQSTELHLNYDDSSTLRTLGWIVGLVGAPLFLAGLAGNQAQTDPSSALNVVGAVGLTASALAGIVLVFQADTVEASIR